MVVSEMNGPDMDMVLSRRPRFRLCEYGPSSREQRLPLEFFAAIDRPFYLSTPPPSIHHHPSPLPFPFIARTTVFVFL
jgi:hypothetical protein